MLADLGRTVAELDAWIERQGFRGWDPFDAMNSGILKGLTGSNRRLGQALVQAFKRCPINLRPFMGVRKGYNPKGMGLFMASYARKYLMTGLPRHAEQVRFLAHWLCENASPGYSGACWGYNFDWPNRGFFAPAGTPTTVNTAFIALAFLDLVKLLGKQTCANWGLDPVRVAQSACQFVLKDLRRLCPAADEVCFSYTPLDRRFIHNANLMGAWLLAEVGEMTSDDDLRKVALFCSRYTARRQNRDGAWLYGEGNSDRWVDNFHTGYVLVALRSISSLLRTREFDEAILRGYSFWKQHLLTSNGVPKYYPNSTYPIDVHSAAQAILTFLVFTADDRDAASNARRMAVWVQNMRSREGYFHYQIHRTFRIRIPYMRWSQAWMQRALVELAWKGLL